MSEQQQKAVTLANALTGERSFLTVNFPITGDHETDFISAVKTLALELKLDFVEAGRALDYLTHCANGKAIGVVRPPPLVHFDDLMNSIREAQQSSKLAGASPAASPYPTWPTKTDSI